MAAKYSRVVCGYNHAWHLLLILKDWVNGRAALPTQQQVQLYWFFRSNHAGIAI